MSNKKTENVQAAPEKKKIFDINAIWLTTVILFLICAVIAGANAVTHVLTKDKIAELEKQKKDDAMAVVVPADSYEARTVSVEGKDEEYYVGLDADKNILGYIFTCTTKGYSDGVQVMTGIAPDGKITKIKILSVDNETPGLGQNATKESFYSQFENKSKGFDLLKAEVPEGANAVKALTGATMTSKGVKADVDRAFVIFDAIAKTPDTEEPKDEEPAEENAEEPDENAEKEETENEQE